MKKSGFTLAEVLITLGIIGVVAALTAPALVMSSRNEANAAKLSVSISNLENAFTNMIISEGVDNMFQTQAWAQVANRRAFAGNIGRFMHINGSRLPHEDDGDGADMIREYYAGQPLPAGMDENGTRDDESSDDVINVMARDPNLGIGTNHVIEMKNGAAIFIAPCRDQNPTEATRRNIINQGGSLFNQAAAVVIDVNGASAPNVIGRDLFYFYLGENGILYPVGGLDSVVFDPGTRSWENTCPVNGNISWNGYACTARVISEGYKITY